MATSCLEPVYGAQMMMKNDFKLSRYGLEAPEWRRISFVSTPNKVTDRDGENKAASTIIVTL